jgi:hypothetical protein
MSDQTEAEGNQKPSKRGEAAWKEAKERVAERNAKARKAGKQQREAYEREQAEARRRAESRQMAELLGKSR